jgi:acyl carrier protein
MDMHKQMLLLLFISLAGPSGCSPRSTATTQLEHGDRATELEKAAQKNDSDILALRKTVRKVIAQHLAVSVDLVDMDKPLCEPPCKADDLDLVEIVMALEERLAIEIPDKMLEDRLKERGKFLAKVESNRKSTVVTITPNELVDIVIEAKKQPPKRKFDKPGARP